MNFPVVDHGFLDRNIIFLKKRDNGLKRKYPLDRPWSYFRDFTVSRIILVFFISFLARRFFEPICTSVVSVVSLKGQPSFQSLCMGEYLEN
jgi:hypothetical protein